jgi:ubiquinone/menaquinone biosynthesis C-methylase UbiE
MLDNSADKIFIIFAAHEIRNVQERIEFFKELRRVLKPTGEIIITEHLRDIPNFLAYNIGFLHFYSKPTWLHIFKLAELTLKNEQKITPFISTFTLTKYGVAS